MNPGIFRISSQFAAMPRGLLGAPVAIPTTLESSPFEATGITRGLIGWWKLDETSGTFVSDSSVTGMHGSVTGGLSFDGTTGVVGNCLNNMNFATKYISVANNAAQNFAADFSLCVWHRAGFTFNKNSSNAFGQFEFSSRSGAGYNGFYFRTGGVADTYPTIDRSAVVYDGNWHHCCVTRSGSSISLYLDGVKIPVVSGTSYYNFSTNNLAMTLRSSLSLDDPRMYNRALSDLEIASLYSYRGRGAYDAP